VRLKKRRGEKRGLSYETLLALILSQSQVFSVQLTSGDDGNAYSISVLDGVSGRLPVCK
jgi:hypothetical protein